MIENGDLDTTPQELFTRWFITPLHDYLNSAPGSIVLLVPSVNDILSDYAVYPQPPLSRELCDDKVGSLVAHVTTSSHVILLNSAYISFRTHANFPSMGCASVLPALMFCFICEISCFSSLLHCKIPHNTYVAKGLWVIFVRILSSSRGKFVFAKYVGLWQKDASFYPLFPVPHDLSHEVNLDVTHSKYLNLYEDFVPHDLSQDVSLPPIMWPNLDDSTEARDAVPAVMVTPSKLRTFHKVDETLAFVICSFWYLLRWCLVQSSSTLLPSQREVICEW